MTSDLLASISGIVLSLLFSYIPGVRQWYNALAGESKRLVMAGLLLAVAVGVFALACAGYTGAATCDERGAVGLVRILVLALVANQSTYLLSTSSQERGCCG